MSMALDTGKGKTDQGHHKTITHCSMSKARNDNLQPL
jgi:hypothetical protein